MTRTNQTETDPTLAHDQALAVDLSCKAAAGDAIAADGMIIMDRIANTRAAGRDMCLVEHATLRRLITAAGYGPPPKGKRS